MIEEKDISAFIYDVIIIGGGPSGLAAALYTSRARLKTLVIEGFTVPSQLAVISHIENYPGFPEGISGFGLAGKFKKQAERFGTEFITGDVSNIRPSKLQHFNIWQVEVKDKTYYSLSVVIASGARPKMLGIPGEEKFHGKGVSYCAVCDGAFFKYKDIVVLGGGDTAAEEAIFLTKFAKKVTLIHRRERLRATKVLQERVFSNEKIEVVWDSVVNEILGSEKVEAVRITNLKTKKEKGLHCEGVFIFIGLLPNTSFVKGVVELDKKGYLVVNDKMKTSGEGIFACGDCRQTILRQIVTACGDGATAAFSAHQYVEELKGTAYK